jgi:mono/diheme cytochrome c family protein
MKDRKVSVEIMLATILFAALTVLLAACSKNLTTNTDSLYAPTAADVTASATLADLQAGRELFINNCGRCHNLYSPDSYAASNWKTIVPGMASRAGLSSAQSSQITKYVTRGK